MAVTITNYLLFSHTYLRQLQADGSVDEAASLAAQGVRDWYGFRDNSSIQTLAESWIEPLLNILELDLQPLSASDPCLHLLYTAWDHKTPVGLCYVTPPGVDLDTTTKGQHWMAQAVLAARNLVVIVISDHGSTRIPAEAPNLIDSAFFAKRILDKHHRYVRISDSELGQLPDNVQYQCYTFERERFGLDANYLAAKAHYRFLPTTESTYIHGGLTPEETLVPVAVFAPLTVSPKPLTVRLIGREFYYARRSEIQVELVNTNAYACESVHLEIQNTNVDAPGVELGTLAPMSQEIVTLEGRFRRSQGDIDRLHIRVTYNFLEQPQQQDVEERVAVKSIMEPAFDLRELL